ncbi:hypothetical protein AN639_06395 [Candidatus Epulonipiscium fishelsonii]|uniref:Uncharacterized protein n=1 Tax=Candidatus Epulonipiscium fishelsonii TaxID=77094 RepID=A0ACC8XAL4_9FIRM|nr:hypothetical protein AN639_06395 [Epulopiscium sp. SCG-B05WGA-EpuloA1]ONI39461.1 hypothetical protein AN396_08640 [Epulopiscium sp. SCG-B11WGA-EpuloA1]
MTKKTFQNLPKDKKNKILLAAKVEFINNGFMGAKVSRICKQAEISRSAFYRYFDSLEDIFDIVIKHFLINRMLEFQNNIVNNPDRVFEICREMLVNALESKEDRLLVESLTTFNIIKDLPNYKTDMFNTLPRKTSLMMLNFMCLVKDFVNLHQKQGVPKEFILKHYDDLIHLMRKGYDNI